MRVIPFGLKEDLLLEVENVPRGLDCGCVCPDPECGRPLVARKGDCRAWHFAHLGDTESQDIVCRGGETALHRFAKQYLCESIGKTFPLPDRNSTHGRTLYHGHEGAVKIGHADMEVPIPGTSRRCDVLIKGWTRKRGSTRWNISCKLAIEVTVSNPKTQEYLAEVAAGGVWSVLELTLKPAEVEALIHRYKASIKTTWASTVKRMIMGGTSNRQWLFRREVFPYF